MITVLATFIIGFNVGFLFGLFWAARPDDR